MKAWKTGLALLLCGTLLLGLSGCNYLIPKELQEKISNVTQKTQAPDYSELHYEKQDLQVCTQAIDTVIESVKKEEPIDTITQQLDTVYSLYWSFYTMDTLARITSDQDLTNDAAWQNMWDSFQMQPELEDKLDEMLHVCAASPLRSDLEDAYWGYDQLSDYTFTMSQEAAALSLQDWTLQGEYCDLQRQMLLQQSRSDAPLDETLTQQLGELFIKMIQVRRQIAQINGFTSFEELCFLNQGRDYTPQDTTDYLEAVSAYAVPLYRQLQQAGMYETRFDPMDPEQSLDQVCQALRELSDDFQAPIDQVQGMGYYDLSQLPGQRPGGNTYYLDEYKAAFLRYSPTGTTVDQLELARLLGSCTNTITSDAVFFCYDTDRLLAQALPYLLLCRSQLTQKDELLQYQLAQTVQSYVTYAAAHMFESLAYQIPDDSLTVEALNALYAQIQQEFGLGNSPMDTGWMSDQALFLDPFGNFSNCVALTAAFDLYQLEDSEEGSGVEVYESLLKDNATVTCLALLQEERRPSPLTAGQVSRQIQALAQLLRSN